MALQPFDQRKVCPEEQEDEGLCGGTSTGWSCVGGKGAEESWKEETRLLQICPSTKCTLAKWMVEMSGKCAAMWRKAEGGQGCSDIRAMLRIATKVCPDFRPQCPILPGTPPAQAL